MKVKDKIVSVEVSKPATITTNSRLNQYRNAEIPIAKQGKVKNVLAKIALQDLVRAVRADSTASTKK